MDEKCAEFLETFKELEERIVSLSNLKGNYIGFSRALDECHYKKVLPILAYDDVYQLLRTASDVRNILSHQNDVCSPTDRFVEKFKKVADEIINPTEVYDICTRRENIVFAQLGSNVVDVVDLMVKHHLSHIPVMEKGKVIGVFSQSTFFQYLYANKTIKADNSYVISDFIKEADYMAHLNETFIFASRNLKAYKLLQYLYKHSSQEKRVSVIFITEHGKNDEDLLGLITQTDLLKAPIYNKKSK